MRIAVSGTHFNGKSTLIEDFITKSPHYKNEIEPYYKLQDQGGFEIALEPLLENIIEQLKYSIEQLNSCIEDNIIFDRCPVDFLAYAMCILDQDFFDLRNNEISQYFMEVKTALDKLDLIVFLPLRQENSIKYTEENPDFRKEVDKWFKKIYQDDTLDIFPRHNHPEIIEIFGDRNTRLKKINNYIGSN